MYRELYIKRRESGLNMTEVAEKLGMSLITYSAKEKGQRDFTLREAKKLAKLFNCTMDELFSEVA